MLGGPKLSIPIALILLVGLLGFVPTVSADPVIDVQCFTASGTWTMPANTEWVTVLLFGGGAGGGGGEGRAVTSNRAGGGGAGGGAFVQLDLDVSVLGATEAVTVGAGGAGGAGGTDANGNDGVSGGTSSFGSHVSSYGGGFGRAALASTTVGGGGGGGQGSAGGAGTGASGGAGGGPSGGAAGSAGNGGNGIAFGGGGGGHVGTGGSSAEGGGGGGSGSGGGTSWAGGDSLRGAGGGGAGSGVPALGADLAGLAGGGYGKVSTGGGGTAGAADGGAGGAGTSRSCTGKAGDGGGGGGSQNSGTGGAGGAGGIPGGAGGSGGGGTNTGGAGGNGARGEVIVVSHLAPTSEDGFNSLTVITAEAPGVNCANGGQKVDSGLDNGDGGGTARDGILQAGEIDDTAYVCNGEDGANGFDTLTVQTTEAPGVNCEFGGLKVDSGLDNGDGAGNPNDGVLHADEIDDTDYVCNGADGFDTLTVQVAESPGVNCEFGGLKVTSGLDNGDGAGTPRDGVLHADEVDDTDYVCNGADGFDNLSTMTIEAPGVNCATGGIKIDSGLDNGDGAGTPRDGILHGDEVDDTDYVCNGATGATGASGFSSLVVSTEELPGANCANGGFKLDSGLDNGDGAGSPNDGILHPDEIDDTGYACNGVIVSGNVTVTTSTDFGIELGETTTLNILIILLMVVLAVWLWRKEELIFKVLSSLIVLIAGWIALVVAPDWNAGSIFAATILLFAGALFLTTALSEYRGRKNSKRKRSEEMDL